jgi:serine/threonine protein kinase
MEWSFENEAYCDFWSNYGGSYKAPEEFIEESYSNEGVDTWALGHGIFGLLTGLFPYYRTFSHTAIRKLVSEGHKPFVDERYRTRSMVEGRLVEIMEQCWEFYAADRPSIYEAVLHIRETKRVLKEEEAETGIVDHNKARIKTYGKSKVRKTKEQGSFIHAETGEEILKRITALRGKTIKMPGLE